ncbi:MAG: glycoside hydrolase, partial [Muribaculaceae bacterium]|nr:glycoside hydrolase [Muribaculaceae bacterium]
MKNRIISLLLMLFGIMSVQAEKIVVAYLTSGSNEMPTEEYVTHINYAFGQVNATFDGITVDRPENLKKITSQKGELKVLLSIGGWTSGGFSEMASSADRRLSFANDCKRVVDEFNLDGIDIDWEYPTSSEAGISSSPDDTVNYTLLMNDIRDAIGGDKLLTLASIASAKYIDFKAIEPIIDFVNLMVYDVARPPYHHAPLYKSNMTNSVTCQESVALHMEAGLPADKIVLGMPFYGHGIGNITDFIDYKDI